MEKLINFLAVGLGGAIGSMMRYGITLLAAALNLSSAIGTLFVNVAGSFLIGMLTGCCKGQTLFLLLSVGLCGGFTTFSTFSLQNFHFFQDGRIGLAMLYIIGTVAVCIMMSWLGYMLGQGRLTA